VLHKINEVENYFNGFKKENWNEIYKRRFI
jgi:hypothetical protein